MNDLLAELKAAARRRPAQSEREILAAGPTTWFSGPAAPAPDGTIALARGDAKIIINEKDVRAVEKDGEEFRVGVSADAHVLLRVERLLKATPTEVPADDCGCGEGSKSGAQTLAREKKPPITLDIGPITVCKHICGWVDIWGIHVYVCVDVDCYVIPERRK